jgi:hypothetical protein
VAEKGKQTTIKNKTKRNKTVLYRTPRIFSRFPFQLTVTEGGLLLLERLTGLLDGGPEISFIEGETFELELLLVELCHGECLVELP